MKRLFHESLRITQVLGVGGKRQVLSRLAEHAENPRKWQEFYLVDGDFDDLLGHDYPDSAYFYRLRRYDIESYLVEEFAVCTVAEEERPRSTADEYRSLLQIDSWRNQVIDLSVRLAACAALLQELEESQIGIHQSIERYVLDNQIVPDETLIDSQIMQVRTSQSVVKPQQFDQLLEQMTYRMGNSTLERTRWISGKHILIPLLIKLLSQHVVRRNRDKESLCFRLAKNCEFPDLADLRARILTVAQQP